MKHALIEGLVNFGLVLSILIVIPASIEKALTASKRKVKYVNNIITYRRG